MNNSLPSLILASNSPRRKQLLGLLELPFQVRSAEIDETPRPRERALHYVQRLAREKAACIAAQFPGQTVIAADTTVILQGRILGKPRSTRHARAMLAKLQTGAHQVATAVAILRDAELLAELNISSVNMRPMSAVEIARYVASGDPLDKAGAYAIQNQQFQPVANYSGCFSGIMGLPLCWVQLALSELGYSPRLVVSRNTDNNCNCGLISLNG